MIGRTHFFIGANAAWLMIAFQQLDIWIFALIVFGGLGGLLPDIDTRTSQINVMTGGATRIFLIDKLFRHRSFSHSLLVLPLIAVLSSFLFKLHYLVPFVFVLGYVSHLFIDGINDQGCEYFYPNSKNFRLIPKFLCVTTGGIVDNLLFVAGVIGIAFLIMTYMGLMQVQIMHV